MTFEQAVAATQCICSAYKAGLQAIEARHRQLIKCQKSRRLAGSVNLDEALARSCPNESRWDYAIGIHRNVDDEAIWVEVHPASSTHIEDMLDKLKWLRNWLDTAGTPLKKLTKGRFYWLAKDGSVNITPNSRQAKQLAAAGLSFPKRVLELDKV